MTAWNPNYLIFNDSLVQKSSGAPMWLTLRMGTGTAESRKPYRSIPRWAVNLSNLLLYPAQHDEVLAFQMQVQGMLTPFLMRNSRYCKFEDSFGNPQQIAVGDGLTTNFQLVKTLSIQGRTHTDTIRYPNWNYPPLLDLNGNVWSALPELVIYLNGAPQSTGFSVDTSLGTVTFESAPASGVVLTCTGGFYTLMVSNVDGIPTTPDGGLFRIDAGVTFSEPEGGA